MHPGGELETIVKYLCLTISFLWTLFRFLVHFFPCKLPRCFAAPVARARVSKGTVRTTYRVMSNGARRGEPTKTKRSDSMASKQRLQVASKTTQRNERWKDRQARTVGKKKGDIRACCSRTTARPLEEKRSKRKPKCVNAQAAEVGSWIT